MRTTTETAHPLSIQAYTVDTPHLHDTATALCLPACLRLSPYLADSLLPPQALPLSAVTLPVQPASLDGGLSPAAAAAAASAKAAGAGIIIDAGFSACYVVPFYDGQLLTQGECVRNLSWLPNKPFLVLGCNRCNHPTPPPPPWVSAGDVQAFRGSAWHLGLQQACC